MFLTGLVARASGLDIPASDNPRMVSEWQYTAQVCPKDNRGCRIAITKSFDSAGACELQLMRVDALVPFTNSDWWGFPGKAAVVVTGDCKAIYGDVKA